MDKNRILEKIKAGHVVVASLEMKNPLRDARVAEKSGADMLELRLDVFNKTDTIDSLVDKVKMLKKSSSLPIIGTVRSVKEGGYSRISAKERLVIYKRILPFVNIIDTEIKSDTINGQIIDRAHKKGKTVILSYHDTNSTPNSKTLNRFIGKAIKLGGDVIKIAALAKKSGDVKRLMMLCQTWKGRPVIIISLGSKGKASRILGFLFGSRMSYGYIVKPLAPGQMSVKALCRVVKH